MILKIIPAKSAFNLARYMLKGDAVLVATNMESVDAPGLAKEFGLVTSINPLKHKVIHLAISHPLGERVSLEQAVCEIEAALKGLGYENCPYHAVEHHDSTKQHFHIATTPTDYDGKRIDRGRDRFKAKTICRRLEKEGGLVAVSSYKDSRKALPPISAPEIQAPNLNDALYAAILPAIKRSQTIGGLAQDLLLHGIQMERTGASGLGFRLLGDQGGYLKASEVHPSFSLSKLQSKHGLGYEATRDDAHLVAVAKKPQQPVQPVLAAMTAPSPASSRVQASVTEITRRLLETYKTRSTYAQSPYTLVAPPVPKRGITQPGTRPATPAIRVALLSAGLRPAAPTPTRDAGRPLRPVVRPGEAIPAPSRPDHAPTVGAGLPYPTPGLAGAQFDSPGHGAVQPRHDSRPDLAAARLDPGGRGVAPGHEGRQPDPGSQAAASSCVPGAPGGAPGREPDRGQRPTRPGAASQRQQDAAGSAHRPSGPAPAPEPRTGQPGVGSERGPGGPRRRTPPGLSAAALAQLSIARQIMEDLPRVEPPRKRLPMTPAEAIDRVVGSLEIERVGLPTPASLPSVDDLVITAQSYEEPLITLDTNLDWLDDYRRQKASFHKSPEKPEKQFQEPPKAPAPPKAAPKPPEPPTPKRSFGRGR